MSVLHFPEDRLYHKGHLWAKDMGNGIFRVGITDYAQCQLGGVIFVDLPQNGVRFPQGESCASIESAKVVSEAIIPLSGTVTAVNEALSDAPELLNDSPYDEGWLVEIATDNPREDGVLTAAAYEAFARENP